MRTAKTIRKNPVEPDPKYRSANLGKFINYLMLGGGKSTATNLLYQAFDEVAQKTKQDPLQIFDQAIKKSSPLLEVRPRRIGGATYQVPMEVKPDRARALAYRAIIAVARKKQGKPIFHYIAEELVSAAKGEGEAVKRRDNLHRLAEANRAFAHYARF